MKNIMKNEHLLYHDYWNTLQPGGVLNRSPLRHQKSSLRQHLSRLSHQLWVSSLTKSSRVRNIKKRRRTADGFKIFLLHLRFFFIKFNKITVIREIEKNALNMWSYKWEGLFVSYWLEIRWEMWLSGLHLYLGISKSLSAILCSIAAKVSSTLWAFSKESPIPFRYCSNGLQEFLDAFPKVSLCKFCIYFTFPSNITTKNQRLNRKIS